LFLGMACSRRDTLAATDTRAVNAGLQLHVVDVWSAVSGDRRDRAGARVDASHALVIEIGEEQISGAVDRQS